MNSHLHLLELSAPFIHSFVCLFVHSFIHSLTLCLFISLMPHPSSAIPTNLRPLNPSLYILLHKMRENDTSRFCFTHQSQHSTPILKYCNLFGMYFHRPQSINTKSAPMRSPLGHYVLSISCVWSRDQP